MRNFTKAAAIQYAAEGIRVNCTSFTDTRC